MYTGIIQERSSSGRASYLRRKVEQYELDKQHNWGRIWRHHLRGHGAGPHAAADVQRDRRRSSSRTSSIRTAGGATRRRSCSCCARTSPSCPALKTWRARRPISSRGSTRCGRSKGSASLDAALVRELMKRPDPQMRVQAIRASETLYKAGDKSFAADYRAMTEDADPNVVIQAMLTLNLHKVPDAADVIRRDGGGEHRARREGDWQRRSCKPAASLGQRPSLADRRRLRRTCPPTSANPCCAGGNVQGTVLHRATARTARGRRWPAHPRADAGAAAGRIAARARPPRLRDQGAAARPDRPDRRQELPRRRDGADGRATPTSGLPTSPATSATASATPRRSSRRRRWRRVREATPRKAPWTLAELLPTVPTPLTTCAEWKLSASHNPPPRGERASAPRRARGGIPAAPQQPGMWFQIELPQPATIAGAANRRRRRQAARAAAAEEAAARRRSARRVQHPAVGGRVTTWQPPVAQGAGPTPTTID